MRSRTGWVTRWRAERAALIPCSGATDCIAALHVHGCYADRGNCDAPGEHNGGPTDGIAIWRPGLFVRVSKEVHFGGSTE